MNTSGFISMHTKLAKNADGKVNINAITQEATAFSSLMSNCFARYDIPTTGHSLPGIYLPKLVIYAILKACDNLTLNPKASISIHHTFENIIKAIRCNIIETLKSK